MGGGFRPRVVQWKILKYKVVITYPMGYITDKGNAVSYMLYVIVKMTDIAPNNSERFKEHHKGVSYFGRTIQLYIFESFKSLSS